jgi:trk system potassium uptake protein TrkH
MTLLETILLLAGGMPLFDSIVHAFGTAGTGGFGIKADSIAGYSPYLQWVITAFMLLFGVNFNLYYLLLIRRFKAAAQSSEFWYYLGIVLVSIALITGNILPMCENFAEALRLSAFQVSSIITTTGYATTDFNLWPEFSKSIILILMMVGACAGSTGGGLKVSRAVMLVKTVRKEVRHLLHPRSVNTVKFEGKVVDGATLKSVSSYFAVYMLCLLATYLLLSLDSFNMETNMSAAFSCFNNIGPGFAAVGPTASYAGYNVFSKLVLSLAMLMGRLEIFPILLTFFPGTWVKK